MSRIWFTADPHFGHRNILQLCDRPFTSVEEMDEGLIDPWNSVIGAADVVWVLGDYAMGDRSHGLSYLSRLAGKKRLVAGNHNDCWVGHRKGWQQLAAYHAAGFEIITPWARARIANQEVMMSHFPYASPDGTPAPERYHGYRLVDEGRWLLHGHVYHAWKTRGRQINVGVDVWNYTPVAAEQIAQLIQQAD